MEDELPWTTFCSMDNVTDMKEDLFIFFYLMNQLIPHCPEALYDLGSGS